MKGRRLYSDIDMRFTAHPVTGDINTKTDYLAVSQSLRHLLMINHYEKPFHPEIGSNIRKLLFEMMDVTTGAALREEIMNTIQNFEPRVVVQSLDVIADYENNGYMIELTYSIVNITKPTKIQFFLERLR